MLTQIETKVYAIKIDFPKHNTQSNETNNRENYVLQSIVFLYLIVISKGYTCYRFNEYILIWVPVKRIRIMNDTV